MDILIIVLFFLVFAFIIKYSPFFTTLPGVKFNTLLFIFFIKCITGVVLIILYSSYYDKETADIYKYFNDGMIMAGALKENPLDYLRMLTGIDASAEHLSKYYLDMTSWFRPWIEPVYNDNRIVVRFNALIGIFSGGNIIAHNIAANFLSFTGIMAIYKFAINKVDKDKSVALLWGLVVFPSLLFWGSGILKECILVFATGVFIFYADKVINKSNFHPVFLFNILFSTAILLLLKSYVILILLPLFLAYCFIKNKSNKYMLAAYPLFFLIWVSAAFIIGYFFPDYNPISVIADKQNKFVYVSEYVEAGSFFSDRLMQPNIIDFMIFIPRGFISTLFRPHLLDGGSLLIIAASVENLLIWLTIVAMIVFGDKRQLNNPLFWLCISFVVFTFTFVGMVTPVFGGLVRYKIPALPFLWIAALIIIDNNKFISFKKRLKPYYARLLGEKN